MNKTIIYIGGYQSGGYKISIIKKKLDCEIIDFAPDYDKESPKDIQSKIIYAIESAIAKGNIVEIIGSSTGGMTALLLSSKYNVPMYLINPLLAKDQFFDQNHPVGPMLKSLSDTLLNLDYINNKIIFYIGENDELLNPNYSKTFAKTKNIDIVTFSGDHAGTDSLEMIIKRIKNN
jgi:hypothetical protein